MTRRILLLAVVAWAQVSRADAVSDGANAVAEAIHGVEGAELAESNQQFTRVAVRDGGRVAGTVLFSQYSPAINPSFVNTRNRFVYLDTGLADPPILARLIRIARAFARIDGSSAGQQEPLQQPAPPTPWVILIAAGLSALAALILAVVRRGEVGLDFRLPHAVPSAIQLTLFLYWSVYWPGVAARVPSILAQLALAYALDAIVALAQSRAWKLGLGPVPIVLSANLFAWFDQPGAILVVVVAVVSRTLIRRGTRPVFNPSALGLAVAGALALKVQAFGFTGTFVALNMAPNMAEVLLLLALLPQIRFRIVLVSLAAAVGLQFAPRFFYDAPGLTFPGTLLTLTLFITDPSTTPRTTIGKILFGLFVGFGMRVAATLLNMSGHEDDFGKVFPVPFANALVPVFDRIGERLEGSMLPLLRPKWNLAHVGLWALVMLPSLWQYKPRFFEAARHWTARTPGIVYGPDDVPRCEENPLFCKPFSFVRELELWAGHPGRREPVHLTG